MALDKTDPVKRGARHWHVASWLCVIRWLNSDAQYGVPELH